MPRSPLTETIKRAEGMVHYVQENLSEEEYMLFLDMVDPLPEPVQKPAKKKSSKKGAGKSTRASGMAAQLNKQLDRRRKATPNDNDDDGRCTFRFEDGSICDQQADVNIHHLSTWAHYHPFVSPVPDAADSLDQPTIETGTDSAGTAASAGD